MARYRCVFGDNGVNMLEVGEVKIVDCVEVDQAAVKIGDRALPTDIAD